MIDMLERAAKAIAFAFEEELEPRLRVRWDNYFLEGKRRRHIEARAALMAAMDASDEALVERLARALCMADAKPSDHPDLPCLFERDGKPYSGFFWEMMLPEARAAIETLKSIAQGEPLATAPAPPQA